MRVNEEFLKSIKIDMLMTELKNRQKYADGYLYIEMFLKNKKITNYYELMLLVSNKNSFIECFIKNFPIGAFEYFDYQLVEYAYNYLLSKVCYFSLDTSDIDFTFASYLDYGYQDYDMFKDTFTSTDRNNTINDLCWKNPMSNRRLPNISVEEFKSILKRCDEVGNACPLLEKGIDLNLTKILIKSLKSYTEQVIRQSIDMQEEGLNTNLLIANRKEKIGLVYRDLSSIIEYLMYARNYQGGEFIFGSFSELESQKLELIKGGVRGRRLNKFRNEIALKVADNLTLKDLKTGIFVPSIDLLAEKCIGPNISRTLRQPISRLFK